MTSQMRAIDITEPGGPEVLQPVSETRPDPGPDEVLIRNIASGSTDRTVPSDRAITTRRPMRTLCRAWKWQERSSVLGTAVSRWKKGDHVTALTHGGGYAEFTAVNELHCLVWPTGYDASLAAAIPENFFTVYYNVFTRSALQSGETILIHGAAADWSYGNPVGPFCRSHGDHHRRK
ncbi:MAG: hypothetical protein CM1200mP20_07790 [Pseudomonadota bacterium]|nr:MAG: hypothetical protein CM1200mP20_07790 [Pseudomonadota bacterium]